MSATLPPSLAAAVDAWLAEPSEAALDHLAQQAASADWLDGDATGRLAGVTADLAVEGEGPLTDHQLDTLAAGLTLPEPDPRGEAERERRVLAQLDAPPAPVSLPPPAERPAARRRWAVAAAGVALAAAVAVFVIRPPAPHGSPLVTPAEAAAPLADLPVRGDAPEAGPGLTLISPIGSVQGAFDLVVQAAPAVGGAPLDRGSMRLIYARGDRPDLTARLVGRWLDDRFVAEDLTLPPGDHPFVVEILDEEQVAARLTVTLRAR